MDREYLSGKSNIHISPVRTELGRSECVNDGIEKRDISVGYASAQAQMWQDIRLKYNNNYSSCRCEAGRHPSWDATQITFTS